MGNTVELHHQLLTRAEALEPLPQAVLRLAATVNDPLSGAEEVAAALGTDPALAAHVLREANSAASAARSAVGTLDGAIARLGAARLLELALRHHVGEHLDRPLLGYCTQAGEVRRHAVATSHAAELTRRHAKVPVSADVVSAALLHDLGKCVIDPMLPADILAAFRGAGAGELEMEHELVEASHAEVGAFVIEAWRLPTTMSDAVRFHHDPGYCPEAATVLVAEHLVAEVLPDLAEEGLGPETVAHSIELLGLGDRMPVLRDALRRRLLESAPT